MNYVISSVKRPRKKYPAQLGHKSKDQSAAQERFLSLAKYHELARRIIGRFAPPGSKASMLSSEDAIDFVAHHIMRGDWAFDPSRGNKISTCRGLNGRLAILEYIKVVSNQRQAISMEFVVDGNRTLSDVSEDPKAVEPQTIHMQRESDQEMRDYIRRLLDALTPVQRSCIALHYLDDIGQADVAKMVGISREGVRRAIAKGMQKLLALATEESEDG